MLTLVELTCAQIVQADPTVLLVLFTVVLALLDTKGTCIFIYLFLHRLTPLILATQMELSVLYAQLAHTIQWLEESVFHVDMEHHPWLTTPAARSTVLFHLTTDSQCT